MDNIHIFPADGDKIYVATSLSEQEAMRIVRSQGNDIEESHPVSVELESGWRLYVFS